MVNKTAPQATNEHYKHLYEALLALKTRQECADFLGDLCTPVELAAFVDRFRIARLLHQGEGGSYRDLHAATGVSVTTVARVARFLTHGYGGYQLILNRLLNTKKA